MQGFMLSWSGFSDLYALGDNLDVNNIPIGCYQTVDQAVDDVNKIGPSAYLDGELTLYRFSFPGRFIGAIPVKKWTYKTDNDRVELSEIDL